MPGTQITRQQNQQQKQQTNSKNQQISKQRLRADPRLNEYRQVMQKYEEEKQKLQEKQKLANQRIITYTSKTKTQTWYDENGNIKRQLTKYYKEKDRKGGYTKIIEKYYKNGQLIQKQTSYPNKPTITINKQTTIVNDESQIPKGAYKITVNSGTEDEYIAYRFHGTSGTGEYVHDYVIQPPTETKNYETQPETKTQWNLLTTPNTSTLFNLYPEKQKDFLTNTITDEINKDRYLYPEEKTQEVIQDGNYTTTTRTINIPTNISDNNTQDYKEKNWYEKIPFGNTYQTIKELNDTAKYIGEDINRQGIKQYLTEVAKGVIEIPWIFAKGLSKTAYMRLQQDTNLLFRNKFLKNGEYLYLKKLHDRAVEKGKIKEYKEFLEKYKKIRQNIVPTTENPLQDPDVQTALMGTGLIAVTTIASPLATPMAYGFTGYEAIKTLEDPTPRNIGRTLFLGAGIAPLKEYIKLDTAISRLKGNISRPLIYKTTLSRLELAYGKNSEQVQLFKKAWKRAYKELPRKIPIDNRIEAKVIRSAKNLKKEHAIKVQEIVQKYNPQSIGSLIIATQSKSGKIKGGAGDWDIQTSKNSRAMAKEVYNYLKSKRYKVGYDESVFDGSPKYHVTINGEEFINAGTSTDFYLNNQINPLLNIFEKKDFWLKTTKDELVAPMRDQLRTKINTIVEQKHNRMKKDVAHIKHILKETENQPYLRKNIIDMIKSKKGQLMIREDPYFLPEIYEMLKAFNKSKRYYKPIASMYTKNKYKTPYNIVNEYIHKNTYSNNKPIYKSIYNQTKYGTTYIVNEKPKDSIYNKYPYINKETSENIIYKPTMKYVKPIINKHLDKEKKTMLIGYKPILYDEKGQYAKHPEVYATYTDAVLSGMHSTDISSFNKFTIKKEQTDKFNKPPKYKDFNKFKKIGRTYVEKRYNRFDTKNERMGNFNIFPYIFNAET